MLHALDAATGKKIWEADTITDHKLPYSSTGAPQIAGDVVVIGNSGADMGPWRRARLCLGLRPGDRRFKWRFYTVPPASGKPYENPELARRQDLGSAPQAGEFNGGGTAWDGFAYDPA
jgi:quinohemoprotein ethanol dehydrogenase